MSERRNHSNLFQIRRNCWRIEQAQRASFLIDADSYFKAFVAAARNAQRSILITGWDFHSRTRLLCEDDHDKQLELELGKFLNGLARRKRGLHIHILIWDYPMIFGLDREWGTIYGLGWRPHRRVHFRYDNTHPVGASHHQKVVVVDDALAFCGGIDLTCKRWDTCEHAPNDARRVMQGMPYPPFHDLTMAVDGAAAKALGDLVRERWRRATGERLAAAHVRADPWPSKLEPSVQKDIEVALSRSEPQANGRAGVREVEKLYLDMIAAARRSIYIENQYFTSDSIGNALAARLTEPNGPELILVLRQLSHGWLEELTMESLRTRLIERLRTADRYGRFRVFYPYVQGLKDGTCIDVHAKMMIVDEQFVRIGSANLANRSMGLDTECDLTIAADGRRDIGAAIAKLRCELLAEHLGFQPQAVQAQVDKSASLREAIDCLQRPDRTLKPLTGLPQASEAIMSVASVVDPERPVALADLAKVLNADVETQHSAPAWGKILAIVAVLLGLTVSWKFTPLQDLLEPTRVTRWAEQIGNQWWAPIATMLAYTPAAFTMFPRPLITLFAVVAFGPWLGFAYAMLGVELSAWITFVAGKRLKPGTVRRVAGARLNDIIQVLRLRGLLAITALRLVPLAPFAVEGIVAGAVQLKLWHFMLGTAIGILPGTLTSTVFGDQLQAALEDPRDVNYWLIGTVLFVLGTTTWLVRRWLMITAANMSPEDKVGVRAV
jgi:phosphatidylserine/phosphatidylglycerophosphate/cardiolipin synthase-like enzyme/uncharacterized membrane protein YdjX (TVP38/TMEM64 family)